MNILSIDTSAKVTTVAIVNEQQILAEFNIDTKLTHSQSLMPMVNAVASISTIDLSMIDGLCVSVGPGSFTGLRIGIGAIKGLAYALDKPCVGVSTLLGLATNMAGHEGIICAVMDARCNQVYTALFEFVDNKLVRLTEDDAMSIEQLQDDLKKYEKNIYFVGDGCDLCYNKSIGIVNNIFKAPIINRFQRASSIAIASFPLFESGETQTAAELMPIYLRLPQAERELLARKKD